MATPRGGAEYDGAMSLRVDPVTSPADLRRFLELPERLHQGDPAFVPPLKPWLRRRLSARNPFLEEADLVLFLARRGTEVVGRISALRDSRHEELRGERVAFFGFLCCEEDPSVLAALLERVEQQAKDWGASILRGPRDLSRIEEVGVTVEGHQVPPPFLAGHHPRYLQGLVEAQGFVKHHDVLAYDIDLFDAQGRPIDLPEELTRESAAVDLPGLELRCFRWSSWRDDLRLAHEVFVDAFRDVPDNTPMPLAQWTSLGGGLLLVTRKEMLQLASVNGQAAGFALCFPEVNEAITAARGELLPTGGLKALVAFPGIKTASFKLLGVLPQWRKSGLRSALIVRAVEGVRAAGYTRLEASLVDERNERMRRIVERLGMKVYRRYRIYERPVG